MGAVTTINTPISELGPLAEGWGGPAIESDSDDGVCMVMFAKSFTTVRLLSDCLVSNLNVLRRLNYLSTMNASFLELCH